MIADLPDGLPPLPPVPEGFDRWEYRGQYWSGNDVKYALWWPEMDRWRVMEEARFPAGKECHYLEAVAAPASPAKEDIDPQTLSLADVKGVLADDGATTREGETPEVAKVQRILRYHGYHSEAETVRELERRAADAEAKVEYARRVGLHVAIGTSTDCPEGRLQHDFTKGTELGRVFDEWSDSIGHEARLARTEAKLTAAESERDALREAISQALPELVNTPRPAYARRILQAALAPASETTSAES